MDSSIGNLANLAFWISILCPVVPKLLLILFLSWLELRSELGNILIKGIKNGWITEMSLWINHVCLSDVIVHLLQKTSGNHKSWSGSIKDDCSLNSSKMVGSWLQDSWNLWKRASEVIPGVEYHILKSSQQFKRG